MRRQRINTKLVLFLFDSDHPNAGNAYGHKFDSGFLRALKAVDQEKATRSLVLRGDLLLDSLCYKPSRVSSRDWKKSKRTGLRTRSSSTEMSADSHTVQIADANVRTGGTLKLWKYGKARCSNYEI